VKLCTHLHPISYKNGDLGDAIGSGKTAGGFNINNRV
jgi:hypothetical protein